MGKRVTLLDLFTGEALKGDAEEIIELISQLEGVRTQMFDNSNLNDQADLASLVHSGDIGLRTAYRRTWRPGDRWASGDKEVYYMYRNDFAKDPREYVHAFMLLQKDFLELFDFVEPADANLPTYSHRIQQLLLRACIEVEANLKAILTENGYRSKNDLKMKDFFKVNRSHRLSDYEVRIPQWKGMGGSVRPFAAWGSQAGGKFVALPWYTAYNKTKHHSHANFDRASFGIAVEAICGLVALLSAQFHTEDFNPSDNTISFQTATGYYAEDEMQTAIGGYFRVRFPDWPEPDRYSGWHLMKSQAPIVNYPYQFVGDPD